MKLTTVLGAVNNNPEYYMFIPKQILFWNKFNINFIAVFVGCQIPSELQQYSKNIILYNKNLDLNSAYVAQNIRLYYPALIKLPDNEMILITDMDMLPMNDVYYKSELDKYNIEDFIYYRNIDINQIYMCYNAAHPKIWQKIFDIYNENDIEKKLYENYDKIYNGIPGCQGWYLDQIILYNKLINYPHLHILNKQIKRLEMDQFKIHIDNNEQLFIHKYDDAHFHRSYFANIQFIQNAEKQLFQIYN